MLAVCVMLACLGGTAAGSPAPAIRGERVELGQGAHTLAVSLACPRFVIGGQVVGGQAPLRPPGRLAQGPIRITYAAGASPLQVELYLQWSPEEGVLRKWARYRLTGGPPQVVDEVILEELETAGRLVAAPAGPGQSYPAFLPGCFAGIEFPVASTRLQGGRLLLAHRPGLLLQPGLWYESRRAVFGPCAPGRERLAFQRYLGGHRPQPRGLHVNYNSWWTSPVPYTEADILRLMDQFQEHLYRPHGQWFDTFCIDMGWSQAKSIWEIDPRLFPHGFSRLDQAAQRMRCHLGLWISPSSCYSSALDNAWAQQAGYETFLIPGWAYDQPARFACLAGPRYAQAFRQRLVDLVTRYHLRHLKFDGYLLECPAAEHGHQPAAGSAEAVAEGLIATFQAVRRAAPDIWLEPTCFGWDPSPWWLWHVNSLIGTYGDDAPYGRVPAPTYRESYTTARDYFNLQGAYHLAVPIAAQEVLGLVHQSPEPFTNDAVVTLLRGHQFLPLYLNPRWMDAARWQTLADLLRWGRQHASLLADTCPLLPAAWEEGGCPRFTDEAAMPRQPYGYAHWAQGQGLVALRNPWIAPQAFSLRLDAALGVPAAGTRCSAVSIYPEPRVYGRQLRQGDVLRVPLAPYETVVLSLRPGPPPPGLPAASRLVGGQVRAELTACELARVEFEGPGQAMGKDWTCPLGEAAGGTYLRLQARVAVASPQAELLVLLEDDRSVPLPICQVQVDGQPAALTPSSSDTGWASSQMPRRDQWLFLRAPLTGGEHAVSVELLAGGAPRLSAWVWATRPGRPGPAQDDNLPQPELISLDARPLLAPRAAPASPLVRRPRPLERIDGIYLDALEPAAAMQGWGRLQRNLSVWEKPLTIAGQRYLRGLGTHAPARLAYHLGGRYRRFQSWVGADGATGPTVTFAVWVDGSKRWESGLMRREDAPQWVDLDLTGAQRLELVVGDGGNGIDADHADWAEARLLY